MIWKQHPRYPNVYVTPGGRVFLELTGALDKMTGYRKVRVANGHMRLHTVIAETWHGPKPFHKAEVRHLDGDPYNNHPANLAWGTRQQNVDDTRRHGRLRQGETHHTAKLTDQQVQEIIARRHAGERILALAKTFGISRGYCWQLIHGYARKQPD